MDINNLINERKLIKINPDKNKTNSSLMIAQSKLEEAKKLLENRFLSNSFINVYTSMFHTARALLYHDGYQEKGHFAVYVYIENKYSNKIPKNLINSFYHYQKNRHNLLYGLEEANISEEEIESAINDAEDFLNIVRKLLK